VEPYYADMLNYMMRSSDYLRLPRKRGQASVGSIYFSISRLSVNGIADRSLYWDVGS